MTHTLNKYDSCSTIELISFITCLKNNFNATRWSNKGHKTNALSLFSLLQAIKMSYIGVCFASCSKLTETPDLITDYVGQILTALNYLNLNDIVVCNLQPQNILIHQNTVKLYNYGLSHVTNYGVFVDFPVFNPRYVAPEVLWDDCGENSINGTPATSPMISEADSLNAIPDTPPKPRFTSKVDVWSLGMILLRIYFGNEDFWGGLKISAIIRKVMSFKDYEGDIVERIVRDSNLNYEEFARGVPKELMGLINRCLVPDPTLRPSPYQLLIELYPHLEILKELPVKSTFPTLKLRCLSLEGITETKIYYFASPSNSLESNQNRKWIRLSVLTTCVWFDSVSSIVVLLENKIF